MFDGSTSINPTLAEDLIKEFSEKSYDAETTLIDAIKVFLSELMKYWTSPKAVEFGKTYLPKLESIIERFDTNARSIIKQAEISYELFASANGTRVDISRYEEIFPIGRYYNTGMFGNSYYGNFRSYGDKGIAGMAVDKVKGALYGADGNRGFIDSFIDAKNKLNGIPTEIALYDPNNELNNEFKKLVRDFIDDMSLLYNEILNQVNDATTKEIDLTIEGYEKAKLDIENVNVSN